MHCAQHNCVETVADILQLSCLHIVAQVFIVIPLNRIHKDVCCWSQAAVLVLFNLGCTLLVFPAVVSLDLRRRCSGRVDILCCCLPGSPTGSEWPCCTLPHVPSGHLMPVASRRRGQVMPEPAKKLQAITRALPPDRQQTVTVLAPQVAPMQSLTPVSANIFQMYFLKISLHVQLMQIQISCWRYECIIPKLIKLQNSYCIVSQNIFPCTIFH